MTAANRAIIPGRTLPRTLARAPTVATCDRPGPAPARCHGEASAPVLAADCPPLLQP